MQAAAKALIDRLIALTLADSNSPLYGVASTDIEAVNGRLVVRNTPARSVAFTDVVKQTGMPHVEVTVNATISAASPAAEKRRVFRCERRQ